MSVRFSNEISSNGKDANSSRYKNTAKTTNNLVTSTPDDFMTSASSDDRQDNIKYNYLISALIDYARAEGVLKDVEARHECLVSNFSSYDASKLGYSNNETAKFKLDEEKAFTSDEERIKFIVENRLNALNKEIEQEVLLETVSKKKTLMKQSQLNNQSNQRMTSKLVSSVNTLPGNIRPKSRNPSAFTNRSKFIKTTDPQEQAKSKLTLSKSVQTISKFKKTSQHSHKQNDIPYKFVPSNISENINSGPFQASQPPYIPLYQRGPTYQTPPNAPRDVKYVIGVNGKLIPIVRNLGFTVVKNDQDLPANISNLQHVSSLTTSTSVTSTSVTSTAATSSTKPPPPTTTTTGIDAFIQTSPDYNHNNCQIYNDKHSLLVNKISVGVNTPDDLYKLNVIASTTSTNTNTVPATNVYDNNGYNGLSINATNYRVNVTNVSTTTTITATSNSITIPGSVSKISQTQQTSYEKNEKKKDDNGRDDEEENGDARKKKDDENDVTFIKTPSLSPSPSHSPPSSPSSSFMFPWTTKQRSASSEPKLPTPSPTSEVEELDEEQLIRMRKNRKVKLMKSISTSPIQDSSMVVTTSTTVAAAAATTAAAATNSNPDDILQKLLCRIDAIMDMKLSSSQQQQHQLTMLQSSARLATTTATTTATTSRLNVSNFHGTFTEAININDNDDDVNLNSLDTQNILTTDDDNNNDDDDAVVDNDDDDDDNDNDGGDNFNAKSSIDKLFTDDTEVSSLSSATCNDIISEGQLLISDGELISISIDPEIEARIKGYLLNKFKEISQREDGELSNIMYESSIFSEGEIKPSTNQSRGDMSHHPIHPSHHHPPLQSLVSQLRPRKIYRPNNVGQKIQPTLKPFQQYKQQKQPQQHVDNTSRVINNTGLAMSYSFSEGEIPAVDDSEFSLPNGNHGNIRKNLSSHKNYSKNNNSDVISSQNTHAKNSNNVSDTNLCLTNNNSNALGHNSSKNVKISRNGGDSMSEYADEDDGTIISGDYESGDKQDVVGSYGGDDGIGEVDDDDDDDDEFNKMVLTNAAAADDGGGDYDYNYDFEADVSGGDDGDNKTANDDNDGDGDDRNVKTGDIFEDAGTRFEDSLELLKLKK